MADLISGTTRGLFRKLVGTIKLPIDESPVFFIRTTFEDEGFPEDLVESVRLSRNGSLPPLQEQAQCHLVAVRWDEFGDVSRAFRVFEVVLDKIHEEDAMPFYRSLRRDGYERDPATGHIVPIGPKLAPEFVKDLPDPEAIRHQLDRIQRAITDDPALAIGSAKELIEATAKVILTETGQPVDAKTDVPTLIKLAQQALNLHPSSVTAGPDGSGALKKILGSVSGIALGVAELRNRGFGTGHGASTPPTGVEPRHAHLAVNAAFTWCHLMLDTLTAKTPTTVVNDAPLPPTSVL